MVCVCLSVSVYRVCVCPTVNKSSQYSRPGSLCLCSAVLCCAFACPGHPMPPVQVSPFPAQSGKSHKSCEFSYTYIHTYVIQGSVSFLSSAISGLRPRVAECGCGSVGIRCQATPHSLSPSPSVSLSAARPAGHSRGAVGAQTGPAICGPSSALSAFKHKTERRISAATSLPGDRCMSSSYDCERHPNLCIICCGLHESRLCRSNSASRSIVGPQSPRPRLRPRPWPFCPPLSTPNHYNVVV
jgi:hypothetical protein